MALFVGACLFLASFACAVDSPESIKETDSFGIPDGALRLPPDANGGVPTTTLSVKTTMYGRPYSGVKVTVRAADDVSAPLSPGADGTTAFSVPAPGPITISVLDLNAGSLGGPFSRDVTLDAGRNAETFQIDDEMIRMAERERREMIAKTLLKIDDLLAKRLESEPELDGDSTSGAPFQLTESDRKVVGAMGSWLLTTPLDEAFWNRLVEVRGLIARNRALTAPSSIDPENAYLAEAAGGNDPSKGISFGRPFFSTNSACRREVDAHEYFHFIFKSNEHYYETKDPALAIKDPDRLAQLIAQIATGCVQNCTTSAHCVAP